MVNKVVGGISRQPAGPSRARVFSVACDLERPNGASIRCDSIRTRTRMHSAGYAGRGVSSTTVAVILQFDVLSSNWRSFYTYPMVTLNSDLVQSIIHSPSGAVRLSLATS